MVADAFPWVVALSSDSEDDRRPPIRHAADMGAVEQYISLDEDGDVQILNVTKPGGSLNGGEFATRRFQNKSPGSVSNAGYAEVFRFAATKDPLKQHDAVVPMRQMNKKAERIAQAAERRARAARRCQEKESNVAEMQLKSGEAPQRRGVPSPTTGLGFIDMERLVTGSNSSEWCHSLRMCQGPELSNLHWNIVRFCVAHELTAEQSVMRSEALEHVRQVVHEIWPSVEVHLFGSTATGLALPSSDIDVAIMSPNQDVTWQKPSTRTWLSALSRNFKRRGQCRDIRQIPFAKVPLLKVVFNSGIACDISFDVANGIRGVPVIVHFMHLFEALRPLCLVLKFFLGQKKLNELYTGGIGSFCLINMVVSHLQNLGVSGSGHDLGILLLSFFNHFSRMHNYSTDVVCTRPGYCAPKHVRGWVKASNPELLSCEDPLDPTSDIAKGSYRIEAVRKLFLKARKDLLVHWHDEDVLSELVDKSQPTPQPKRKESNPIVATPASAPGGKKKSKKRKKKMKQQGVGSGDEENSRARKIRKVTAKSVQQVSDSSRRRPPAVHRPAKLQKRKKKQKVERIYVDCQFSTQFCSHVPRD